MMMEKQSRERGTLDGPKSRITALCSMVSWHLSHAHHHQHPAIAKGLHAPIRHVSTQKFGLWFGW